jgi:outer membrane murein-binding lipoprotein Lpp
LKRADAERKLDADPNPVTVMAGERGCRILATRLPAWRTTHAETHFYKSRRLRQLANVYLARHHAAPPKTRARNDTKPVIDIGGNGAASWAPLLDSVRPETRLDVSGGIAMFRRVSGWYAALSIKALLIIVAILVGADLVLTLTTEDSPDYYFEIDSIESRVEGVGSELDRLSNDVRQIADDVRAINNGYCVNDKIC